MQDDAEAGGRYAAFISYSRKVDLHLAPALEDALERFAKPWYRPRALRVFRDDADLSANAGLWTSITEALADSEVFILLASPPAADSKWVAREVEYWRKHKDVGRLLIVPTEGELAWDETARDFDWTRTTALPKALRGAFSEEPRYTDLRWARNEERLTLDDDRFSDAVADLAGTLHGRPKDEMYGEQVRQHRRTIRLARSAVLILCALVLAASIAALLAVRASNRAEAEARESLSRQLAAQSLVAQDDRRFDLALLLSAQAHRTDPTPQARDSLLSSLLAVPRLRTTLRTGEAVDAAASKDQRSLALRTANGRVTVWEPPARGHVGRPIELAGEPLSMALSPDGGLLAVGYPRHRVELWDVARGARVRELTPSGRTAGAPYDRVLNVDFGANRRQLVWNLEFDVAVWDGRSVRRVTPPFAPGEAPFEVALSSNGLRLAVGSSASAQVASWRLTPSGRPAGEPTVLRLEGVTAGTSGLAFSPSDPELLAVGGVDGSVTLWDGDHVRKLRDAPGADVGAVQHLSSDLDGRLLAVVDEAGTSVWDVRRRTRIAPEVSTYPSPLGAVFLAEERTFASIDQRGAVFLVDLDAPRWPPGPQLLRGTGLRDVDLSPKGDLLAGLGPANVRLWDAETGRPHGRAIPLPPGDGVEPAIRFDSDSGRLAVWDSSIQVWAADTGESEGDPLMVGDRSVVDVAFRPEGLVAGVGESAGSAARVRLWDVEGKKPASPPIVVGEGSVEFGPDLRFAAVPGRSAAELRELDSGRLITSVGRKTSATTFSHDGSLAAVAESEGPIRMLDTETGAAIGSALDVGPGKSATALVFSGDDSMLAVFTLQLQGPGAGSFVLGVQLWDVIRRTLIGGRSLVDGTSNANGYSDLAFAADAPKLVMYGPEDRLFLWDLDPASWSRLACRLAGRNLTREEWRTYVGADNAYEETCS